VTVAIGTADPVVVDDDVEHAVAGVRLDLGGGRPSVLDDVRQRLCHDEVRARLDLGLEPVGRYLDRHR